MSTNSTYSLGKRFLLFLLIPLLLGMLLAGFSTFHLTKKEINQLHDDYLKHSAGVLSAFLQYEFSEESDEDWDDDDEDESGELVEELIDAVSSIEQQQDVSVNYRLSVSDRVVFTSADVAKLPTCGDGFDNVIAEASSQAGSQTVNWRCYSKSHPVSGSTRTYRAEFFERMSDRSDTISSVLKSALLPLLAVPLFSLAIVWLAIRLGMREIVSISDEVGQRSIGKLDKITLEKRPQELLPVIESVNRLMHKVRTGIEREKQFTDDAAHELRTPLTSISMTEQLIRRENKRVELIPLLDQLKNAINQCQDLIGQLLRFARLQSQNELTLIEKNVSELIQEQLNAHAPQLLEKNLIVDFQNDDKVILNVDEAAMKLALGNLINNAVKFSPFAGTVFIKLNQQELLIEDQGVGIEAMHRDRIFDRFFRAPETRSTPGTGLGLALAKWVTDLHGFDISCIEPKTSPGAAIKITF